MKYTDKQYDLFGLDAPKQPESLPRLLNLAVENVPEHMNPAILNSLFPALEALMRHVGFRYPLCSFQGDVIARPISNSPQGNQSAISNLLSVRCYLLSVRCSLFSVLCSLFPQSSMPTPILRI